MAPTVSFTLLLIAGLSYFHKLIWELVRLLWWFNLSMKLSTPAWILAQTYYLNTKVSMDVFWIKLRPYFQHIHVFGFMFGCFIHFSKKLRYNFFKKIFFFFIFYHVFRLALKSQTEQNLKIRLPKFSKWVELKELKWYKIVFTCFEWLQINPPDLSLMEICCEYHKV